MPLNYTSQMIRQRMCRPQGCLWNSTRPHVYLCFFLAEWLASVPLRQHILLLFLDSMIMLLRNLRALQLPQWTTSWRSGQSRNTFWRLVFANFVQGYVYGVSMLFCVDSRDEFWHIILGYCSSPTSTGEILQHGCVFWKHSRIRVFAGMSYFLWMVRILGRNCTKHHLAIGHSWMRRKRWGWFIHAKGVCFWWKDQVGQLENKYPSQD